MLRDVLTREVPLLFKPGQFYALTAAAGWVVFVALVLSRRLDVQHAALFAIATTFLLHLLAIQFDWQNPRSIGKRVKNEGADFVTRR